MEYGNNTKHLKRTIIVGTTLGMLLLFVLVMTALDTGKLNSKHYLLLFGFPFLVGSLLPIILITMLPSLRIKNDIVQSILLGRWVVKEAELSKLEAVEISKSLKPAVILHFSDKIKIKLWGANVREIKRLMTDLKTLSPTATFIVPPIQKRRRYD